MPTHRSVLFSLEQSSHSLRHLSFAATIDPTTGFPLSPGLSDPDAMRPQSSHSSRLTMSSSEPLLKWT